MKTNYLKILACMLLFTFLIQNAEAQKNRHRRFFPRHDSTFVRDTAHQFRPDTTLWVRDTTHHLKRDTSSWLRDTTHRRSGIPGWVRDTTHHWKRDTTGFVRDTTHHWSFDSTSTWVRDSIHQWTPNSNRLNRQLLKVKSSIYPNPSLSGDASITIDAPVTETFIINVYNTGGILISTQSVTGGTTLLSILTSGFYYYHVINSSGVKVSGGIIVVSQ
jgi:hypothetical protein